MLTSAGFLNAGSCPAVMYDQGSELDRLWNLLQELSAQLTQNRQQTEELHRRAGELKSQAIHSQTGFALRRFNVDISKEEFESELERMNVNLVLENQNLQHENRQMSILLKDYESTLETVMAKFRSHAHATQQHHLDLVRHYETLLAQLDEQTATNAVDEEYDPLQVSLSLSHVASLVRKALRSLQGEDPETESSPFFTAQDGGLLVGPRDRSEGGYIGKTATTDPHHQPTTSTTNLVDRNEADVVQKIDDALDREAELEALRRENEVLRHMLGIQSDEPVAS